MMTNFQIVSLILGVTSTIVFTLITAAAKVGKAFGNMGAKVEGLTAAMQQNANETKENRLEMSTLGDRIGGLSTRIAVLEEKVK